MRKCKDCNEWKLIEGEGKELNGEQRGRCHGGLPTVTAVVMPVIEKFTNKVRPEIIEVTMWPVTPANCCGCGEFKPPHVHFDMVRAKLDMIKKEVKEQVEGKNG